jgi:hypothetical protein
MSPLIKSANEAVDLANKIINDGWELDHDDGVMLLEELKKTIDNIIFLEDLVKRYEYDED